MGITDTAAERLSGFPIPWVKHESSITADPCIRQFIDQMGFEGYGRYWRLIELLSDSATHELPPIGARGYKRFLIGLGFADDESFDTFLNTLISLDLAERTKLGRYRVPMVDEAAEGIARAKANGSKGGRKAAANRKLNRG